MGDFEFREDGGTAPRFFETGRKGERKGRERAEDLAGEGQIASGPRGALSLSRSLFARRTFIEWEKAPAVSEREAKRPSC
jgi:hypothetical protein